MRKNLLIIYLSVMLVFTFGGCGVDEDSDKSEEIDVSSSDQVEENEAETPELTVGFIYIGTINDGGFTQTQHQGTIALEDSFAGKVKCIWLENIDDANTQAAESAALQLIDQGANVIVGTSFGFGDALLKMAESGEYDDITFLHFSGSGLAENMGNYFGAMEEPRYLSGIIAGMQTKSNKLGYVAAFPYTEVMIGINAFTLGAQSVNPDVTVNVVYINSWYDPANEKAAAESLLSKGCDVITQHADTVGPQLAAANEGKLCIGYNLDNSEIEGLEDAYLTAPIWHHEVYLIPQIHAIMDGTWVPESYYGNMADGYVSLTPLTKNVSAKAKAKVKEIEAKIISGEMKVFTGPITDSNGEIQVKEGESLDRAAIWATDYVVKGVIASQ